MKNALLLLTSILLLSLPSCKDKCGLQVSIDAVLPDNNPVDYEVLIKTEGFGDSVIVYFGNQQASLRQGDGIGEFIATVPNGLSGNVEVSVEEEDCIARFGNFVVTGALPSNVQPSLTNIVLPTTPSVLPTDGFTNFWPNAADSATGINLKDTTVLGVKQLSSSSKEFNFNPGGTFFNENPVSGSIDIASNVIFLAVDRTAKGGTVEHFDGQFIEPPGLLPANAKYAILLVSRETGRQMLLYFPE